MRTSPHALEALLLYQDNDVLVLNKPAGLACHVGPKTRESLEAMLPGLAQAIGQKRPLFLAHRLDQDTSGCLLIACGERARKRLQQAFEQRLVEKLYWAWVGGVPKNPEGTIEAPLAKVSSAAKGWRMLVNHKAGQQAITAWRVLESDDAHQRSLLAISPLTGRTHQVRAHCAYLGHPIIGDRVYGSSTRDNLKNNTPLQLHARALCFIQPMSQQEIKIVATTPEHFMQPAACS
jgi:RluA family pseudouridine synthase